MSWEASLTTKDFFALVAAGTLIAVLRMMLPSVLWKMDTITLAVAVGSSNCVARTSMRSG